MTHTLRLICLVCLMSSHLSAQSRAPQYEVLELGLPPEGDPLGNPSSAVDINEGRQIVGQGTYFDGPRFIREIHPVLWQGGETVDLGLLPSRRNGDGVAYAVNNRGQVVGYSPALGCEQECSRAFLWEGGTMTDLGSIGEAALASDINEAGLIVGVSTIGAALGSPRVAVLWDHGAIINLVRYRVIPRQGPRRSITSIKSSGRVGRARSSGKTA